MADILMSHVLAGIKDEGLIAPASVGRERVYGERERVRPNLVLRGKRLALAFA